MMERFMERLDRLTDGGVERLFKIFSIGAGVALGRRDFNYFVGLSICLLGLAVCKKLKRREVQG